MQTAQTKNKQQIISDFQSKFVANATQTAKSSHNTNSFIITTADDRPQRGSRNHIDFDLSLCGCLAHKIFAFIW